MSENIVNLNGQPVKSAEKQEEERKSVQPLAEFKEFANESLEPGDVLIRFNSGSIQKEGKEVPSLVAFMAICGIDQKNDAKEGEPNLERVVSVLGKTYDFSSTDECPSEVGEALASMYAAVPVALGHTFPLSQFLLAGLTQVAANTHGEQFGPEDFYKKCAQNVLNALYSMPEKGENIAPKASHESEKKEGSDNEQ